MRLKITEFPLIGIIVQIRHRAFGQLPIGELPLIGRIRAGITPFTIEDTIHKVAFLHTTIPAFQAPLTGHQAFLEFSLVMPTVRPGQAPLTVEQVIFCVAVIHGAIRHAHIRRQLHRLTARQQSQQYQQTQVSHKRQAFISPLAA